MYNVALQTAFADHFVDIASAQQYLGLNIYDSLTLSRRGLALIAAAAAAACEREPESYREREGVAGLLETENEPIRLSIDLR